MTKSYFHVKLYMELSVSHARHTQPIALVFRCPWKHFERENIFYPFPWGSGDRRPNQVSKLINYLFMKTFFCCGAATQRGSWPPHSWGFLDHTQWRTKVGRTPLDEWSARRKDLYLTTHNTRNRQTSMPPVRFEPTISAGERPQTYALDRAATGTGSML